MKRYLTLDAYYKDKYKSKVARIPLNAGFSCPNLDGKLSFGGCIFCLNGSKSFVEDASVSLKKQFEEGKEKAYKKWGKTKYIAYFGTNTNTYASLDKLKEIFLPFLEEKDLVGIDIATRADSLTDEAISFLSYLNKKIDITIELGLQTTNEKVRRYLNRHESLDDIISITKKLKKEKIKVVIHIINGLPGDSKKDMLENIYFINKLNIDGIKIHSLFLEEGSALSTIYLKKPFPILSLEEYVSITVDQIETLKKDTIIYRITGDPIKDITIAPKWALKKLVVINEIDKELKRRNTYEGFRNSILNYTRREIDNYTNGRTLSIDMTMGNGHDSLYLARNSKYVYSFDVSPVAIERTNNLLKENNISNVKLINDSHSNIDLYLNGLENKFSIIIFNLGYLPKSDKKSITKAGTTIKALDKSFKYLHPKGVILITIYKHEEGIKEEKAIYEYLNSHQDKYEIFKNTDNINAPYLLKIYSRN